MMAVTLARVISGGQTGADQAGLRAARATGLETGGWAPRGFRTADGPAPDLGRVYGLVETVSREYPPRTAANAREADATVRLAVHWTTRGEQLTVRLLRQYGKPFLDIQADGDPADDERLTQFLTFLQHHRVRTLNVAGNSEASAPGIGRWAETYLRRGFLAAMGM